MLEFNNWYFVLLANFLILLVVLNSILFQPLKKVFKDRKQAVDGSLNDARVLVSKKDENIARMNSELTSARVQAREIYGKLREEGQSFEKDVLSKTEAEAVGMIEKARRELQDETRKARESLKTDIDRFSDEIVKKMVRV